MSLFGGLPGPQGDSSPEQSDVEEELAGLEEEAAPPPEEHLRRRTRHRSDDEDEVQEGPVKRPRPHAMENPPAPSAAAQQEHREAAAAAEAQEATEAETIATAAAAPAATKPSEQDQIAAALRRITSHISNPSKFLKAAPLLRQLLDSGTLGRVHRTLTFDAIRAVFSLQPGQQKHLFEPSSRREMTKLMSSIEGLAASGYFTAAERAQIEHVYVPLGSLCTGMLTDDSFMFSKVLSKLRTLVDQLPDRSEGDAEEEVTAFKHVTSDLPGTPPPTQPTTSQVPSDQPRAGATLEDRGHMPDMQASEQAPAAQAAKPSPAKADPDDPFGLDAVMQAAVGEDDPFGLGALLADQAPKPPPKPKAPPKPKVPEPVSSAWNPEQLLAARRCAVLTCVQHARTFHKHAWAQTSIEALVEHCWNNRDRVSSTQVAELEELWSWVRKARALRKQGPTAKEINRDTTSFERARADWSRVNVSARGKVGSNGDAKSASWLG